LKDSISKFVLDWKTLVGMILITVSGMLWLTSQLDVIESRLNKLNIKITEEFGNIRAETAQYHAIVSSSLKQQEQMESRSIKGMDEHKGVDTRNRTALWNAIRELRKR